jgi:hypothetical protein
MAKITKQIENTVINQDGEVLKQESIKETIIEKEPNFVKVYLADLSYLKELPKWTNRVLYELLSFMNYENEIILNSYLKEKISKKLDIKLQSFANSITKFLETGILLRKGRETYIANPKYFGKGSWAEIKSLRLKVTYNENGREFETEVERDEENPLDFINHLSIDDINRIKSEINMRKNSVLV